MSNKAPIPADDIHAELDKLFAQDIPVTVAFMGRDLLLGIARTNGVTIKLPPDEPAFWIKPEGVFTEAGERVDLRTGEIVK